SVPQNLRQQRLGVVVELTRGGLGEDPRKFAFQLPRVEEELPVDVVAQGGEVGLHDLRAREGRSRELVEWNALFVRTRLADGQQWLALLLGVLLAQALPELPDLLDELDLA